MRVRRVFVIAVVALISCAAVVAVWCFTHRSSNADVYLLVTSSIQGGITPARQGDTRLGGLILMSTALKEEIKRFGKKRVAIIDAGNSLFNDSAHAAFAREIPQLFQSVGYHAVTLGYRDFEILRNLCQKERFPVAVAGCNVKLSPLHFKNNVTVQPRIDLQVNGLSIAVIGVVDPDIKSEQGPDDLVGVELDDQERTLERVQAEVERVPADVDLVVVLSSALREGVNYSIAERCPRVDIIASLGGDANGWIAHKKQCSIISAASRGRSIGLVEIHADAHNRRRPQFRLRQIRVSSTDFAPDPGVRKMIHEYWLNKLASPEPDRVIGSVANKSGIAYEIEDDLRLEHPAWTYFNRPMYNLVVDALRYAYPFKKDVRDVNMAIYNTGAIEAGLGPGFVTLSHLQNAIPYNNRVVHVTLTGAQILEMLNSTGMRRHGILCACGLEYTWDYEQGLIQDSVFLVDKKGERQPLQEDRQYTLVLTDFLAAGGDNYLSGPSFASVTRPFRERMREGPLHDYPTTIELLEYYFRECSPVQDPRERAIRFRR